MMLLLAACAAGYAVERGMTLEQVLGELGPPAGELRTGDYHLLRYVRGTVELRSNRVAKVSLMSPEEAERLQAEQARAAAIAARQAEAARAARIAEGTALREAKKKDAAFWRLSAAEQTAYWAWFTKTYPEVPVSELYLDAARRLEAEQVQRRLEEDRSRTLADLERRAAEAERRAQTAEDRLRRRSLYSTDYGWYGSPFLTYPVTVIRPSCPPSGSRTVTGSSTTIRQQGPIRATGNTFRIENRGRPQQR